MDKVEGYNGIYKDSDTGVIINRSGTDRERYLLAKENALKTMNSHNEIEELKSELSEIKTLLKKLVS